MASNPPAFPHAAACSDGIASLQEGMSLRDWFAGQAPAGIMANPVRWEQIAADYKSGKKTYEQCSQANATKAYSIADAMLAERKKGSA
jgi:hypothetical protein